MTNQNEDTNQEICRGLRKELQKMPILQAGELSPSTILRIVRLRSLPATLVEKNYRTMNRALSFDFAQDKLAQGKLSHFVELISERKKVRSFDCVCLPSGKLRIVRLRSLPATLVERKHRTMNRAWQQTMLVVLQLVTK